MDQSVWYNPYIAVPLITWAIAQFTKFCLAAAKGNLDPKYLYASGGMPSVHSATVVSLAMTALLVGGPQSAIFGFTAVFAAIVMYDSFGVRRATGEQAAALNVVVRSLEQNRLSLVKPIGEIREILGHKPLEVTVGAIFGFVLGALLNYDQLDWLWNWLASPVNHTWALGLLILGAFMVVGAIAQYVVMMRRYKGVKIAQRSVRWASAILLTGGLLTMFFAFMERQNVAGASSVFWPILVLLLTATLRAISWNRYAEPVKRELAERAAAAEKAKWLEPSKKKKKSKKRK